jgi:hypothetical protein
MDNFKEHFTFIEKLVKAQNKNLEIIKNNTNICKYLLQKFKSLSDLPSNYGGETLKVDKAIKKWFKETEENVCIDPNGTQAPPDIVLNDKYPIELKSAKNGVFQFNDSQVTDNFIYIFIHKTKNKIFITNGGFLPKFSLEIIRDIEDLRKKYNHYYLENPLHYGFIRPNRSFKSKFMEKLPYLSYFDGEFLWI